MHSSVIAGIVRSSANPSPPRSHGPRSDERVRQRTRTPVHTAFAVLTLRPRKDSNLRTRFRKPMLYPLSYGGGRSLRHYRVHVLCLRHNRSVSWWVTVVPWWRRCNLQRSAQPRRRPKLSASLLAMPMGGASGSPGPASPPVASSADGWARLRRHRAPSTASEQKTVASGEATGLEPAGRTLRHRWQGRAPRGRRRRSQRRDRRVLRAPEDIGRIGRRTPGGGAREVPARRRRLGPGGLRYPHQNAPKGYAATRTAGLGLVQPPRGQRARPNNTNASAAPATRPSW